MSIDLDKENTKQPAKNSRQGFVYLAGIIMVTVGVMVLADQFLKTGWLLLALVPIFGIFFIVEAIRTRKLGYLIAGGLLTGAGLGGFVGFSSIFTRPNIAHDVGWLLVCFALGWVMIATMSRRTLDKPVYWPLVPGGIILSIGLTFLFTRLRVVDFVLWVGTGTGLVLLIWGIYWRLFGLIIPGSLLMASGTGIYMAWGRASEMNSLAKTGVMLVIFSIGWFLIILFSRVTTSNFIWWPLIPGGILAVVGWGLYIGGDPGNAASFIANTGSIGLIIFGIYLLLLRKSIHR